ncbi:hypothetical protein OHA70_14935 [Kribbella sp. NBC_00382]|uniref:hypothetical protein n=1 Tax=Kribbella sp. NBC_00382 TaxID=2975967 RepID=UPI002E228CEB
MTQSPGALALLAVQAERAKTTASETQVGQIIVPLWVNGRGCWLVVGRRENLLADDQSHWLRLTSLPVSAETVARAAG